MFKLLLAFPVLILAVVSFPVPPSPGVIKADLLAAGLSEQAADGVLKVASSECFSANKSATSEEAGPLLEKFQTEVDTYIKTQSAEDQAAYKEFSDKKKGRFRRSFGR